MGERYLAWLNSTADLHLAYMLLFGAAASIYLGEVLLRRYLPPIFGGLYLALGATVYVVTFAQWLFITF